MELTNATDGLYTLLTAIFEERSNYLLVIFFISSFSFLLSLLKLSYTKKHNAYNLYRISYALRVFTM